MNFMLTEKESFYLRRYAALQFPGSIENYSTRHPIHFLEEKSDDKIPVSASDFNTGEIVCVENETYPGGTYASVEELIGDTIGLDIQDSNAILEYNENAKANDKPQFVTFEKAMMNCTIPGVHQPVYDMEDYLSAYGLEPDYITFYRAPDAWDVKGISFTHKGAKEVKDEISNHLFRETRFYAFTTTENDFPVMMNLLYKLGLAELAKETSGYNVKTLFHLSKDEITEKLAKEPHQNFAAAKFEIVFPEQRSVQGTKTNRVTITVSMSGMIKHLYKTDVPLCKINVATDTPEGIHMECPYPFECDRFLEAIQKKDDILTLFNYAMYC